MEYHFVYVLESCSLGIEYWTEEKPKLDAGDLLRLYQAVEKDLFEAIRKEK